MENCVPFDLTVDQTGVEQKCNFVQTPCQIIMGTSYWSKLEHHSSTNLRLHCAMCGVSVLVPVWSNEFVTVIWLLSTPDRDNSRDFSIRNTF